MEQPLTQRDDERIGLLGRSLDQLHADLAEAGQPRFRADQLADWVFHRRADNWDQLSNIPKQLRGDLALRYRFRRSRVQQSHTASDGAGKLLLEWPDGALTETVLIPDGKRLTVCVSTQVGCAIGCRFCASGLDGLQRSLTADEIVEQVIRAGQAVPSRSVTHVVFMGTGEPLLNLPAVLQAVTILNAEWGLGIGARHITISTVGLPDGIAELAAAPFQITLAISLHAPTDELRRSLIPLANTISLKQLFTAIDRYFAQTHRQVTLEYVLLKGVNDQREHAERLAELAKRARCHINLIRFNGVAETGFQPPSTQTIRQFADWLGTIGASVTIRKSMGGDIDAACGQLRRQRLRDTHPNTTAPTQPPSRYP